MDDETLEFLAELEQKHRNMPSNESLVPAGERECPICKAHMHVEREYGIQIDVCEEHGVWLDCGELPAMFARIRSGESIKRKQAIERARQQGRLSGGIFGAFGLLYD